MKCLDVAGVEEVACMYKIVAPQWAIFLGHPFFRIKYHYVNGLGLLNLSDGKNVPGISFLFLTHCPNI